MIDLWNLLLYKPILNALIFLYNLLGHNFGLAIIFLTLAIRGILVPITLPALKSARAMRDLKPELDGLRKKYKKNKKKLQKEQIRLYKEHGINPAAGCLPQILQFLILIALYRVFMHFIQTGEINDTGVEMGFLWLNLSKSDPYFFLPILAGFSQLIIALMITPRPAELAEISEKAKESPQKTEDTEEMAMAMQKQMIFMMPLMTILIGVKLPSGLALYWLTTTLFSIFQQYFISGTGGLTTYLKKLKIKS